MNKFVAAATLALCATASAAQADKFTVAHGFVPAHTAMRNGVVPLLECVTAATNGELTFDHFPSGELSGHKESITSLSNGLADFSMVIPGYEQAKLPLSNMAMLPGFGTTATQMDAGFRTMIENGSPMLEEWHAQGIVPIMTVMTPAYQLMSMKGPVNTIEDFTGMLLRAGGGTANLAVASLGAVPVEMASPDMFLALQRGTVDATILSMTSAPAYGLPDILKSVTTNGSFSSGMAVMAMNKAKFDALSDAHRTAILDCGRKTELLSGSEADKDNDALKAEWAAKGITMYEMNPELMAEVSKRLATVAEEYVTKLEADGNANARKTYEIYVDLLK